jgi:hypothetical protein
VAAVTRQQQQQQKQHQQKQQEQEQSQEQKHPGLEQDHALEKQQEPSVTEPTAMPSNLEASNPPHSPALTASSPPVQSPEFKPSSVPYNAIPMITPPLDAISAPSVAGSVAPSMADWRGGLAGSPGNLILMGESPPTQPSSYEDSGRIHRGWPTGRSPVGSHPGSHPSSHGASPSPPGSMRRPLSINLDPSLRLPDRYPDTNMQGHGAGSALRRGSVHSQFGHARSGSHPFAPLPHQVQAHFYGAPDIDFGTLAPHAGMKAGERGYFFGFDTLPRSSHHGTVFGPTDAVLAGYEGGLEVYALGKRGLDHVGALKGLRGGVYHAKILPWTPESDAAGLYPLVAVVVHGPVLPPGQSTHTMAEVDDTGADTTGPSMPGSPRPESVIRDGPPGRPAGPLIDSYQTTVEIHSLQKNKLLSVLLVAPKCAINTTVSLLSPLFKPPPPTGAFQIRADSGTVAVASGITGECWLYRHFTSDPDTFQFACVGKLWTSIQQSSKGARAGSETSEDMDRENLAQQHAGTAAPARGSPQMPIIAINGRWIAYCPAAPSSQITLRAHVPVAVFGKAPGLSTVTPPPLPSVSASLDMPVPESMVNRIVRETTQELISGAKWVGQQGMHAWNSYWSKPAGQQPARSPPGAPQWTANRHDAASQFPPTHGIPEQTTVKEPGLVTIVDLDALGTSSSLHPLTTFAPPLGCSFLSFSPNGLSLFTASTKGDVQSVWDLMRIQFTKTSALQAAAVGGAGPCVRQVAQFSRMTVARIVDVAWVKPRGRRIAVVTERGTVHLMDMSSSAFSWPPPRRRKPIETTVAAVPEQTGTTGNAAVSMATTALGAAFGVAKPLISRQRRSSGPVSGLAGTAIVDSANQGGRAIAATISNSLGKTGSAINQYRQNAENRVSLPSSGVPPCSPCVVWVTGKRYSTLCVVGDGMVRMFAPKPSRRSGTQSSTSRRRVPKPGKYNDFRVQSLPDGTVSGLVKHFIEVGSLDEYLELSDRDDGANTLTLETRPRVVEPNMSAEAAIPHAEIESSAPYQPFHTDRRVSLLEYQPGAATLSEHMSGLSLSRNAPPRKNKDRTPGQQSTSFTQAPKGLTSSKAWSFGRRIPAVRLELGHPPLGQRNFFLDDEHRALPSSAMERVMHMAPNDDEIVVTTRKRRHHQGTGLDEDGFFEDDCEVLDFADQRV